MAVDTMQQGSQRDPLLERLGNIDQLLDHVEDEVDESLEDLAYAYFALSGEELKNYTEK